MSFIPRREAERINLMVVDLHDGDVALSFADAVEVCIHGIIHKATQEMRFTDSAQVTRSKIAADAGSYSAILMASLRISFARSTI